MTAQNSTSSRPITLAVNGAAGRMGRRLVAISQEVAELKLVAALDAADVADQGRDAGELAGVGPLGVPLTAALPQAGKVDVMIDFSSPAGTAAMIEKVIAAASAASAKGAGTAGGVRMVIGTTGLSKEIEAAIARAAEHVAIVYAPNMSVGVNVLLKVAAELARLLGPAYDIELVEAHHRFKKDAPSGTALALARSIAAATGRDLADDACYGRHGDCPRKEGEIGIHAVRAGDIVGDHTIFYGALGERIELRHVASTRDTFVRGALRAAIWLAHKPAGLYTMQDVLGL